MKKEVYLAIVKKDNRFGVIDTKGDWFVLPEYDNLFKQGQAFLGSKINIQENTFEYFLIIPKISGVKTISIETATPLSFEKEYCDGVYPLILPRKVLGTEAKRESDVITPVFHIRKEQYALLRENDIILFKHPVSYVKNFSDGLASYVAGEHVEIKEPENKLWGYLDTLGNIVIQPAFEKTTSFENGRAVVVENGKYFIINNHGYKLTSALPFDEVSGLHDGMAEVRKNNLYGIIDASGHEVVPVKYGYVSILGNDVLDFYSGKVIERNVYTDGNWGVMDTKGKILIEPVLNLINSYEDGLMVVNKGEKWGLIGKDGQWRIPASYEFLGPINGGLMSVEKDGKYGFVNTKNEWAIAPTFENVSDFQMYELR